ncbi:Zinc finger protein Gfi-1b [Frankliniella fusca]|uniref:Zinc finger protein Gfi-1b n=1 Tax=Frankliniella fusca TaxID=407009 RepID=A0AAE1L918_9NEOP|nr:Zinc finger protein Gfi-1b [Frankliniella fusca]
MTFCLFAGRVASCEMPSSGPRLFVSDAFRMPVFGAQVPLLKALPPEYGCRPEVCRPTDLPPQASERELTGRCLQCKEQFITWDAYTKHVAHLHAAELAKKYHRPYSVCGLCGLACGHGEIQKHLSLHKSKTQHRCLLCPARFNSKMVFDSHVQSYHQI